MSVVDVSDGSEPSPENSKNLPASSLTPAADRTPGRDVSTVMADLWSSGAYEPVIRTLSAQMAAVNAAMAKTVVPIPKIDLPIMKIDVAALLPGLMVASKAVANLAVPKIDVSALLPKIDTADLFPELTKTSEALAKAIAPAMESWSRVYRDQFAGVAEHLAKITKSLYPPNWQDETMVSLPKNLDQILLDEGLPLAWVPPHAVLVKLFAASTPGERRTILSNHWRQILASCVTELESISESKLKEYVEFALEAAESLGAGRWKASQALSANLMDTILHRVFDKASRQKLIGQKSRIDYKSYPIKEALVLGGIWGSYSEYWTSNGDLIPRRYTRHASAHGVSRRQYTRLNSLVALMHVVGLLKVIEFDASRARRRSRA